MMQTFFHTMFAATLGVGLAGLILSLAHLISIKSFSE